MAPINLTVAVFIPTMESHILGKLFLEFIFSNVVPNAIWLTFSVLWNTVFDKYPNGIVWVRCCQLYNKSQGLNDMRVWRMIDNIIDKHFVWYILVV